MAYAYSEHPRNWNEIETYVNQGNLTQELFRRKTCYFYDTCSFRYHANMRWEVSDKIFEFIRQHDGMVVILRSILMELSSMEKTLNTEYVQYFQRMRNYGLPAYVIYEEELFDVMCCCYSTNVKVNSLLMWAVRTMKGPVSTITETLEREEKLASILLKGRNLEDRNIFKDFFSAVRKNKEAMDNLGEELLGICLHILSQLPGEEDGKFCVLIDDKGAAGKIDRLFKNTPSYYRGKRIIMYSTPKLAQYLYKEGYLENRETLLKFLETGGEGNVRVLGTQVYDLVSTEISLKREELADQILENKIHITF